MVETFATQALPISIFPPVLRRRSLLKPSFHRRSPATVAPLSLSALPGFPTSCPPPSSFSSSPSHPAALFVSIVAATSSSPPRLPPRRLPSRLPAPCHLPSPLPVRGEAAGSRPPRPGLLCEEEMVKRGAACCKRMQGWTDPQLATVLCGHLRTVALILAETVAQTQLQRHRVIHFPPKPSN